MYSRMGSVAGYAGEGAAMANLVCLTIQAIFSVVRSSAAMTRSPSFSRSAESSTTRNSPRAIQRISNRCTLQALSPEHLSPVAIHCAALGLVE